MADSHLQLLGPPQIQQDGQTITVNTRKAIALSAYLAVTNRRHNRETLIALLWPNLNQQRGRAALRTTLSVLKKALGGVGLIVENELIGLDLTRVTCDVTEFTGLIADCQTANTPDFTKLSKAATQYQDTFMAGFTLADSAAFDAWQREQTDLFRRQLSWVLQQLTQADTGQVSIETAVHHARRWVILDPLHEPAHYRLMQLYAAQNLRSAALRQYQTLHQLLAEEVDAVPDAATTAFYLSLRDAGEPVSARLTASKPATPPLPATPLVGREAELAQTRQQLADPACRLFTLVGPGGIGKTRLGLEIAQDFPAIFTDGCVFVPLASVANVDLLTAAMADALGFSFYGRSHPQQQLLNFLQEKRLLLILDNFEHLLAGTTLITATLQQAPHVKLLVTSRERLNLQGEWVLPLSGLAYPTEIAAQTAVPPSTYSAIQLFLQAAQRSAPGFEVDLPAIAAICRLVEGMPLGIELAAAWARVLPCDDIAQEISRNFDFLAANWRDLPARHRSLRAVFDHSWALLTDAEQAQFRQLAVFRGSFDRAAAEAITGVGPPQLVMLADKSLLRWLEDGRYAIPEALRSFAAEKRRQYSHEQQAVARRYGRYFADLLQQHEPHLKGGQQIEALAAISVDIEHVRRAWEWAVSVGDTAVLAQSLASLALFYEIRGYFQEGLAAFQAAAQALQPASHDQQRLYIRAQLLAREGRFCHRLGRYDEAQALLEESLTTLQTFAVADGQIEAAIAFVLNNLGYTAWSQSEYESAQAHYQQSLVIYRQLNDKWGQSHILNNLAILPQDLDRTRTLLQESRAIAQEIGDLWGLARVLNNLGIVMEDKQAAWQLYQESAAICRQIGDRFLSTFPLTNLGHTARQTGEFAEARRFYTESLNICREIGYQIGLARNWGHLGTAAYALGDYATAVEQCRTGLTICEDVSDLRGQGLLTYTMGLAAAARAQLDRANVNFQQSLAIFRQAGEQQGVAWPLLGLARLALQQGQIQAARKQALAALSIFEEVGDKSGLIQSGNTLGIIAIETGDRETAVYYLTRALTIAAKQQNIPLMLEGVLGFARLRIWQTKIEQAMALLDAVLAHSGAEAAVKEQARPLRFELGDTAVLSSQPIPPLDNLVAALLAA